MNSTIKLYQVEFTPERNAWVDDIAGYLGTVQAQELVSDCCQYIKHGLDINIKLPMPQSAVNDFGYNYVAIKNKDDVRTFYYFVINTIWRAQSTIELQLSMDTINTFQDKLTHFNARTEIKREHSDRFYNVEEAFNPSSTRLPVIIDQEDEGLGSLPKFKEGERETIRQLVNPDQNWYLIYNSDKNISTNPEEIVPISCYLAPEKTTAFATNKKEVVLKPTDLIAANVDEGGRYFYIFASKNNAGKTLKFTDTSNTFHSIVIPQDASVIIFRSDDIRIGIGIYDNRTAKSRGFFLAPAVTLVTASLATVGRENVLGLNIYQGDYTWYNVVINYSSVYDFNAGRPKVAISGINVIDRTLTTIIKIIELPYSPKEIVFDHDLNIAMLPQGWDLSYNSGLGGPLHQAILLKINDLNTEFYNKLNYHYDLEEFLEQYIPSYQNRVSRYRDKTLEPKLLHSSFFNKKYIYDNYSKDVKLENIEWFRDDDVIPSLSIAFKPTNTMNSNFLFDFQVNDGWYRSNEDYENVLIASRSNEYPVYNSAYLNYLRTGYQFDKEKNARAAEQRWTDFGISTVVGIAGTAALFGTGKPIGAGAAAASLGSTAKGIANNIFAQKEADAALAQSLEQARMQGASVQGSNDLDLLNYYNGNKLLSLTYGVSRRMRDTLFDLFWYTGYKQNIRNLPDINSRRSFNYLQCTAVFRDENDTEVAKYMDDIKSRYEAGVTYFHKFYNGSNDIYDFNQIYENWETWICPREKQEIA